MLRKHAEPFVQKIEAPWVTHDVQLFLKREDVIHPHISGNKWWKLADNLREARAMGAETIVTFGGAFSNHIYATAAAAREAGFSSAGIIRGEEVSSSNPTLQFAQNQGMDLYFADRKSYRNKVRLQQMLASRWSSPYFLPEGGTNCLAVNGCREIITTEMKTMDVIAVPAGTGGTMAGIIAAVPSTVRVMGFSALKGDFLTSEIEELLEACISGTNAEWQVVTDAHCGGYARINDPLISFIRDFREEQGILLDPLYNGKMMFRLKEMIGDGFFLPGTRICAIHTGGLQGWNGIALRYGIDLR